LGIVITFSKIYSSSNANYGVVTEISANVKSSPDEQSTVSFIVHEGLKVKIEDKIDTWYKIRLNDGKIGWVEKRYLGII
jgi:SH3-like domain-containing protein